MFLLYLYVTHVVKLLKILITLIYKNQVFIIPNRSIIVQKSLCSVSRIALQWFYQNIYLLVRLKNTFIYEMTTDITL